MDSAQQQYVRLKAFCTMQIDMLNQLYWILRGVLLPMVNIIISNPKILLHPSDFRRQFFMNVWNLMADSVDEGGAETKRELLPTRAQGTVLEIGAGSGHSIKYLDTSLVKAYIALEPNTLMHGNIYNNATKAGFQPAQITILDCGAQDTDKIMVALRGRQVDTIVSILTLCGIPDLENTLEKLIRDVLKPGGAFIFYEHVLCDVSHDVRLSQKFWTPVWQFIVGCRLDNPSHRILERLPVQWIAQDVKGKKDEAPNLWWHQQGYFVKA